MTVLPPARAIRRHGDWTGAYDLLTLPYDERFLRRKVLTTAHDERFLVDLPHTTSVDEGDAFELNDGRLIEVCARDESLLEIRSGNLVRLDCHIGNRHCPCQIEPERLLIQRDPVIRDMLVRLGAEVEEICAPFRPEGGAYGMGDPWARSWACARS